MSSGCLLSKSVSQYASISFQLSYQNKSCSECQQDVKKSVRQMGRYTVRQADRVTDRQNDSMTVWQNSRAAKEPALVLDKTL